MDADALGIDKERPFPSRFSVASTHNSQLKGLCGPSPAVPHIPDPVCRVSRSTAWRQDRVCILRWAGRAVVFLAVAALSRALRARLADRATRLFGAVFVSNEHGQGAAPRYRLRHNRDSPVLQEKILAIAAAGARLYLDL